MDIRYNVGDRVCGNDKVNNDEHIKFTGRVCGHGWADGMPMVLVQLDKGAYVENYCTRSYVSILVVHIDNIRHQER